MKMLLTGDSHCKNGIYVNICTDYIDYLTAYAKKNKIKTIVFLGDILDKASKIHYATFVPLFNKFKEVKDAGFDLYFIVGNHEMYTDRGDTIIETFSPFGTVIKTPMEFEFDGVKINMCPYTLDRDIVPTVNADYLFTHLPIDEFTFDNGMEIKDKSSFEPSYFSNYKKVYTGHYHRRQEKHNIQYVGSPYQLSFGEAGDDNKGFVVFEPSTGKEEFVKYTGAPTYYQIDYDTLMNEGVEPEKVKNAFIKIDINKKIENFSKLRNTLYKAGAIEINPNFKPSVEVDEFDEEVRVEIDKSIEVMLYEFVKSKSFYYGKEKLDNNKLVDMLKEIQSEF